MLELPPDIRSAFLRLAPYSLVGAAICDSVSKRIINGHGNIRQICTSARISLAKGAEVQTFLELAEGLNLFLRVSEMAWTPLREDVHALLAPLLHGASLYRERIHQDNDLVEVVLTMPPAPSRIASALEATRKGSWGFVDTKELLPAIAESAKERFVVMTPYLDEVGAPIVLNLYRQAKCDKKILISRFRPDGTPPPGLNLILDELQEMGTEILDCRIKRIEGTGMEMSHAKVVASDYSEAYVGSTNMNRWSFDYSLELGIHMKGQSAAQVVRVTEAVANVSNRI